MTTKITSANITQSGTSGISSVAWQAVQTTGFTAVAGRAYPCNTTSAAFTVTLPASPAAGNVITLTDYAGTWDTNNLTINPNGGKINGSVTNLSISTERGSINLVYVDSTQGWISYASNSAVAPIAFNLEYLVVAGGAGGATLVSSANAGGGGAGGYQAAASFSVSTQTSYTLTVGAGGPASTDGNNSVFSSITAYKGGKGGDAANGTGGSGSYGSGGGGGCTAPTGYTGGAGTSGQGNSGGTGTNSSGPPGYGAGGGGGSGGAGGNGSGSGGTGVGGLGTANSISGSSLNYAGGGGGANNTSVASGGSGVGGNGASGATAATAGSTNRGGGGGGGGGPNTTGGNGGSGVVVLKIPDTRTATFSGGVTSSLSTAVAGYKIYTITNTSTTSETVTFS